MMSASAIRSLSREAAEEAAAENKEPLVLEPEDVEDWRTRCGVSIPNLGDHRPAGWDIVGDYDDWLFVDKSGMGAPDEPALTISQFLDRMEQLVAEHPDWGYGIVEEGQFQLYVAAFRRV